MSTVAEAAGAYWGVIEAAERRYGSLEAWQAADYGRAIPKEDQRLARAISSLMSHYPSKPRGTLRPPHRQRLLADRDLCAYWASVIIADAWDEEFARLARRQREAAGALLPIERLDSIGLFAIVGLLPYWRSVGRTMLNAKIAGMNDLCSVIKFPGAHS